MPMIVIAGLLLLGLCCGVATAKGYETQAQALTSVFASNPPGRKTLFLTDDQAARVEKLARAKLDSRIVSFYVGKDASGAPTAAFFDRQIVRSMPVTYMVTVKARGEVERVEILAFDEPDDYFPSSRWLSLFKKRGLNDELALGRSVPRITGSSLTSQAMVDGVRRALAIFEVGVKGTI